MNFNIDVINSRLLNCDLLLEILREEPKPIILDFSYLNENKSTSPTKKRKQVEEKNVSKNIKKYKVTSESTCTSLNDVSNTIVSKSIINISSYQQQQQHQHQISTSQSIEIENQNKFQFNSFDFFDCLENFVFSPPEEFDNIFSSVNDDKALIE